MSKNQQIFAIALIICLILMTTGCQQTTRPGTQTNDSKKTSSPAKKQSETNNVDINLDVRADVVEPGDRVKLYVTVKNGLITTIKDVKTKIMTTPINVKVDDVWKNVAASLKGGRDKDTYFYLNVKEKDDFSQDKLSETLRVRVKYLTSLKMSSSFKIADSQDVDKEAEVPIDKTSFLVPMNLKIDPMVVALSSDSDVRITLTIKKDNTVDNFGLDDSMINTIQIEIPGVTNFDLNRASCDYIADTSRKCHITGDLLELQNVEFPEKGDEIEVDIILPLKESTLPTLKGTEKSVIVTLKDIWLYIDKEIEVEYKVE